MAAQAQFGAALQQALADSGQQGTSGFVRPVGFTIIDGAPAVHVHGSLDLGRLASQPALPAQLGELFGACGVPANAVDTASLQLILTGATVNLDAYLQEPGNFPRRFTLELHVPLASFDLELQGDLTPLQAPAVITPPAQ